MKRLLILLVFVLVQVAIVEAQTVQYGIFTSGTNLLVKA